MRWTSSLSFREPGHVLLGVFLLLGGFVVLLGVLSGGALVAICGVGSFAMVIGGLTLILSPRSVRIDRERVEIHADRTYIRIPWPAIAETRIFREAPVEWAIRLAPTTTRDKTVRARDGETYHFVLRVPPGRIEDLEGVIATATGTARAREPALAVLPTPAPKPTCTVRPLTAPSERGESYRASAALDELRFAVLAPSNAALAAGAKAVRAALPTSILWDPTATGRISLVVELTAGTCSDDAMESLRAAVASDLPPGVRLVLLRAPG